MVPSALFFSFSFFFALILSPVSLSCFLILIHSFPSFAYQYLGEVEQEPKKDTVSPPKHKTKNKKTTLKNKNETNKQMKQTQKANFLTLKSDRLISTTPLRVSRNLRHYSPYGQR
jgi:hypothetical protein